MPTPESTDKPAEYGSPRPNVYTSLLVLAVLALIVGVVLLYRSNVELSAQHAKDVEALRNARVDSKAHTPPHPLEGVILTVTPDNMVELSIGADDGLRKGDRLEVVRGDSYLGRIEVTRTTPDRAVCRMIPETFKSPVKRGDRVYDRLE